MAAWNEGFHPDVLKGHGRSTVDDLIHLSFQDTSLLHQGGVGVPRVVGDLLVSEAELSVVRIDLENDHFHQASYGGEFTRVLDLLRPTQIGDVDQAVNTFLQFDEDAKVGEVADSSLVLASLWILGGDVRPRIRSELLHAQRHLALFHIQRKDDALHFLTCAHKILCTSQVGAPRHF